MGISSGSSGPNIPSPLLADVGKGRIWKPRRIAVLERHDGAAWTLVGRYGSVRDADEALDRELAGGADAGTLRVVVSEPRSTASVGLRWVGIALLVAWPVILYLLVIR
jgi:hypothetical protein